MSTDVLRRAASGLRADVTAMPEQTATPTRVKAVAINSRTYLTIDPAVALAVADWLDVVAERWDTPAKPTMPQRQAALTAARTYLGETEPTT